MTGTLLTPSHMAIIVVVLLLLFGANRLPQAGRSLGAGIREFKDGITGAHGEDANAITGGHGEAAGAGADQEDVKRSSELVP